MSIPTPSPCDLPVAAPAGQWPMDRDIADVSNFRALFVSTDRSFGVFQNAYSVKLVPGRDVILDKELRMMLLADNVSVTPPGRVFDDGIFCGAIMPYERPITTPYGPFEIHVIPQELTRTKRLEIIDDLCLLMSRLHAKGIIHGDVKPTNLLRCSDGSLRFCDFAEALVDDSGIPSRGYTLQNASPVLLKPGPSQPLTKTEDLYSLGITIW